MAAAARALQHALVAQPPHDRHIGRVRPWRLGPLVEGLHHQLYRGVALTPDLLHDLGFELMQDRGAGEAFERGMPGMIARRNDVV